MSKNMSSSTLFKRTFSKKLHPLLFGMIHVPALPGTPNSALPMEKLAEKVRRDTEIYAKYGIDGIILENMHDVPYQNYGEHVGPEVCATMARLCWECANALGPERRAHTLLGVQILAAANKAALAVAQASGFDFIRAEAFVFGHVADEGWMNGCAGSLLRYRRSIGAGQIAILTDIKKKHCAHALTADVSIEETAKAAEFFLSDGLILTGTATGQAVSSEKLKTVRSSTSLPVLIGSGITTQNIHQFGTADGFIVGSYLKEDGKWYNEIDEARVERLVGEVKRKSNEK